MLEQELTLGIYQNLESATHALKLLKKQGFKAAVLQSSNSQSWFDSFQMVRFRHFTLSKTQIKRFQVLLMPKEVFLLVESDISQLEQVLLTMRRVKNNEPVTFVFLSVIAEEKGIPKTFLPRKPLTHDGLMKHAANLAKKFATAEKETISGQPLLKRLLHCKEVFERVYHNLNYSARLDQSTTLASEWLLDNSYVIQAHIEDIRRNLPKWFYEELPEIPKGPFAGLPRVYGLAVELVAATDGRLDQDNIKTFLNAYQTITPLSMGELWAIPLLIRLRLIECLEYLAVRVIRKQRDTQEADFWANRLLTAIRKDPDKLYFFLAELSKDKPFPSCHFGEQLIDHLTDEKDTLLPVRAWLSHRMGEDITTLIRKEQHQLMTEQVSLSNAITSLLRLSRLDWREVFEATSVVDQIFAQEASGLYLKMDFDTRDLYRHALEKIAKRTLSSECFIAQCAVDLTKKAVNEQEKHLGYYLIGDGRKEFASLCGYKPTLLEKFQQFFKTNVAFFYVLGIITLTIFILWLETPLWLLAIIVATEIALLVVNYIFTLVKPPFVLPKMSFKEGIPEGYRTLVVVPIMLTSAEAIRKEIEKLEIRYLANPEENLRFAIFSDFTDAPEKTMPEDQNLLEAAKEGIERLNANHKDAYFFLFHRERSWNEAEKCWMGWERKRGKIETLNRFLLNKLSGPTILFQGNPAKLEAISFVITLDSDTELLRNKARCLVEALAHPLNRPWINPKTNTVQKGYGLIQPRVSTSLLSKNSSYFNRIFSDPSGTDPYNWVVSDLYQDVFSEGIYHGKGIYDLKAFDTVLDGRFPDNSILSHDLLEGCYARTAFASDIELFDQFPENYAAYIKRLHRWIRGDWQILAWLFPKVPTATDKKEKNPLSFLSRWKIFDNLRRSLVYPSALLLLIVAGFQDSLSAIILVVAMLLVPAFIPFSRENIGKNLLRALLSAALLPHHAYISLDAIGRSLYRKYLSHHLTLEWQLPSSEDSKMLRIWWIPPFALLLLVGLFLKSSPLFFVIIPFLLLWVTSPVLVYFLNKTPVERLEESLKEGEKIFLKIVGRKTWRYFDDFVNESTNWLPPDNFQEMLNIEVANRTSSTNIGLYLVSILTAYDFGYVTSADAISRIQKTLSTMEKLELYEGHLLNWYNTATLMPLQPKYVSTVDSGNLIASLWTLEQGIQEILEQPILSPVIFSGLADMLVILSKLISARPKKNQLHLPELKEIAALGFQDSFSLEECTKITAEALAKMQTLLARLGPDFSAPEEIRYWIKKIESLLTECKQMADLYFPWVQLLLHPPKELFLINFEASAWIQQSLASVPSWLALKNKQISGIDLLTSLPNLPNNVSEWISLLKSTLDDSAKSAAAIVQNGIDSIAKSKGLGNGMRMRFLYHPERKLFSIGYNVNDCRLDSSFYDLLASEARIASFIAIAQEDVPVIHWWTLGRPFGYCYGHLVLQSWGGTMFEYMMPVLFMHTYEHTLLEKACRDAVKCQIEYGKQRGIPWGISESAYSGIDFHKIYQYRAFGVPGLGLKRGLEDDLVITPYSSGLALMMAPNASALNLYVLDSHAGMMGAYGFYEAIDYTREHDPQGKRGVIIYAYMAHHSAMTFIAINNLLNDKITQNRFHRDPRVQASDSLLFERIPAISSHTEIHFRESPPPKIIPVPTGEITEKMNTPNTAIPHTHLISNGTYSIMNSNSGSGYSVWNDIDVTRWRADSTSDHFGTFFYIKDVEKKIFWSSTYAPLFTEGDSYNVNFKAEKSEFKRRDQGIETQTEITVSPEDQAEIRVLTLANLTNRTRILEVTSYQELALAPHAADRAHPAFSKMFVQTELISEPSGLLATRRQSSPEDPLFFAMHACAMEEEGKDPFIFETNREKFIGSGRSLTHPLAMDSPLTNSVGFVLDPIFSIRKHIVLEPGKRVKIAFVTGMANSRKDALGLLQKYRDFKASLRGMEMAWANAELNLRFLHITNEKAHLFQLLASRIIYPHSQLRASADALRSNRLGQKRLWGYGISGDLPIVAISIGNSYDVDVVKELLIAHTFWRMHGLKCDLVILNEEKSSYEQTLGDQLQRLIQAQSSLTGINKPGGNFLLSLDKMPEEDVTLIQAVSRIFLNAARGSIRQQLSIPIPSSLLPPTLVTNPHYREEPSPQLPFLQLLFFNGMGGFTTDGKEYAIFLESQKAAPHPWINVIANKNFGLLASAKGLGTIWSGNSQSNRLTPWFNDPVVNPITDIIYLRNEESGTFWTITPSPINELDPYRTRHGQGYTIYEHNSHAMEQQLLVFVPFDHSTKGSVRIQKLSLFNKGSKRARISAFSYLEWVLGTTREECKPYVVTFWDSEIQTLFAKNAYNPDFGSYISFVTSMPTPVSYSGDRTEFLGRNRTLANPEALKRVRLTGKTGPALDPCAALQVTVDIDSQEHLDIIFLVGQAPTMEQAQELIYTYRDHYYVESTLESVKHGWENILTAVQIETPDVAANILFNRWLLYQNLSCRIWGRTAFYQSSGAFGFRDQLQDVSALVYAAPELTREHILYAASRQFPEGDVQHWWHPQTGEGVRTRITDDLLWLPYVTSHYIRITGDRQILQEIIPFLQGEPLPANEMEHYGPGIPSTETATLLDHCCRAIQKACHYGPHGLPLMGGGDWNDGMNNVGSKGKGESVWLAWFLISVMQDFIPYLPEEKAQAYREECKKISIQIEKEAWDGEWYLRAYYDDGAPLGSKESQEAKIESMAQSWGVISGAADAERIKMALDAVERHLVKEKENMVLLFEPPFDHCAQNPGYIKGYPPGVRENGGQYTHAALWLAKAFAQRGEGNKAVKILNMLNPINHSLNAEERQKYQVEPYAVAADIYSLKSAEGEGGWTWYTGSAGVMYRVWVEDICGLKPSGDKLEMDPCIPSDWERFRLFYRYKNTHYEIIVENPNHHCKGVEKVELDGNLLENKIVPLKADDQKHIVRVFIK